MALKSTCPISAFPSTRTTSWSRTPADIACVGRSF